MGEGKKEQLRVDLKRRILTMLLAPGALLDEAVLGDSYELPRTTVRDVVQKLASEGYILIRDDDRALISPMSRKSIRDFFHTAPMIYASVARLAAQKGAPEQVRALKEVQENFRKAVKADIVEDMVFWNDRFHFEMGVIADNQYLMPSLQRLLIDHARIGQTFWRPRDEDMQKRVQRAADHHDRFIGTIETGDEEEAVALTMEHWSLSRDFMEMFVHPDPPASR